MHKEEEAEDKFTDTENLKYSEVTVGYEDENVDENRQIQEGGAEILNVILRYMMKFKFKTFYLDSLY